MGSALTLEVSSRIELMVNWCLKNQLLVLETSHNRCHEWDLLE